MSIYSNTLINKRKRRKISKKYLVLMAIFVLTVALLVTFNIEKKREIKPFFKDLEAPLVIAHRGGSIYPENTMPAFQHSIEIGADVIEFDVHMTKDEQLVVIHDATVNRTTNGTGTVNSFTLDELKQLDAGFTFTDQAGMFPFRNQGITIPTVREIFEQLPNIYMNIEIKAQYPNIEKKLWALIQEFNMEDKVLLASFDQKIIEQFAEISNGKVAISGGKSEVTKLVLLQKFFLGSFYFPKVDAIQIPTRVNRYNLEDQKLINRAHTLNMPVLYWTINDEQNMKKLLLLGADGIITDKPGLLIGVIKELGLK